ncbi:PAS and ANTAR domain-containing protein [Promicromonospora sp. NPDC019610]|uniref:PAS and ANTAR domain-containing protein n=1 Tax=Promicromonospora sp. NPDC019610 TaxID=3364405 RepID=UPI00378FE60A
MSAEPLEIERALTLGANHTVGHYRYDLTAREWWWSDEVYRIHGFEPGDVVPTTELILAHKHPEDRSRVSRILAQAATTGEPFSSVHRIMDATGQERTLTVVGRGRRDPQTDRVTALVGYFVDVTAGISRQANQAADTSIRASAATRAPIEQAKGIVAITLGVGPEDAFDHMRVTSNVTNIPVREIARRIVQIASTQGSLEDVRDFLRPSSPA